MVKKKSDMRTNMTSRLLVAQAKVYSLCDKDGKVQPPKKNPIHTYLVDI